MSQQIPISAALAEYIRSVSLREPEILQRLREENGRRPNASMQIAPEQGQFMAMLVRMLGAKRTIEVGVFTGYSSLSVALALPEDGCVVACDVSAEYTAVARRYWQEAGVAQKIDLRLAPALDSLDSLLAEGRAGSFDFAFIDADKKSYEAYYERTLALLRPGGVVAVDNVLWHGRLIDANDTDADTEAIRAFNRKLHCDERVYLSLVPIGDGMTLAYKRG